MKVHKHKDGSTILSMSDPDLAALRRAWRVLEELAHYGRNDTLTGFSRVFNGVLLEGLANDVGALLNHFTPPPHEEETDGRTK